jgi:hypothetical protein
MELAWLGKGSEWYGWKEELFLGQGRRKGVRRERGRDGCKRGELGPEEKRKKIYKGGIPG